MPRVRVLKSTALSLCDLYYKKRHPRICSLRPDTLGQILTRANVHSLSQVLVFDDCMGIVTGAILERLEPALTHDPIQQGGRCLIGYDGQQPSLDALRRLNFGTYVYE